MEGSSIFRPVYLPLGQYLIVPRLFIFRDFISNQSTSSRDVSYRYTPIIPCMSYIAPSVYTHHACKEGTPMGHSCEGHKFAMHLCKGSNLR